MPQLSVVEQFARRLAQERREKAARDRSDIQKQDVAEAVGVSKATYGRYEAGLNMPDDPTLMRLAAYFGVTPAWLRYGQEPRVAERATVVPVETLERPAKSDAAAAESHRHGNARKAGNVRRGSR